LVKTLLFVAKVQKAHGVCSGYINGLDCHPDLRDTIGVFHFGHHWQRLYAVHNLQPRRRAEGDSIFNVSR